MQGMYQNLYMVREMIVFPKYIKYRILKLIKKKKKKKRKKEKKHEIFLKRENLLTIANSSYSCQVSTDSRFN